MPKAKLSIELDGAKDYFDILKGGEDFKHSKVSFKVNGNSLSVEVVADDARSMTSAIGSVVKQLRIIEEASEAISKK